MKENVKFVIKVAIIHVLTYIVCGMIFASVFDYEHLFKLGNAQYYMKDAYSFSSLVGPVFQIVRGILLGLILLLMKDSILQKKNAWLYLWIIFIGFGVICTPGASPCSIEGLIYTQIPLEFHLKTAPEIIIQPLIFSILVTKKSGLKISDALKLPLIVTVISAAGFSLGGIILVVILGVDFMASASDPFAFVVMLVSLVIVFFITKAYLKNKNWKFGILYYIVCYISLAGFPTAYNFMTDSTLKSPLSLIVSALPVLFIAIVFTVKRLTAQVNSELNLKDENNN